MIFTSITFLRLRMKTRKNSTGPNASCAFRKWAKCQKRFEANKCKKTLMKTKKNIAGPHASVCFENGPNAKNANENEKMYNRSHASVYFENGQNAKNAYENEKMYNRATCLRAFQKWAECQKRLKSTELR